MLKYDFNTEISQSNPHTLGEVALFRGLIRAFSTQSYAHALESHAAKGFVKHKLKHKHIKQPIIAVEGSTK